MNKEITTVDARNYIRLGKIEKEAEGYLELGLAQQALATILRIGEPSALDVNGLYILGESLRLLKRYDEAVEPLQQAAKSTTENIHILLALGWCYKRIGRLDLAINTLEEALAVEPDEPILRYNLACYFSLAGNKNRALRYLSQTLSVAPDYRRLVDEEPDFNPIRSDPDFQSLCRKMSG
jgi:tetratricopeptide (TPR) repeat protein